MNADNVFELLDPPPGGATRFAQRLDEAAALATTASWPALAVASAIGAVAVAAVAVTVVLLRDPRVAVAPVAPVASSQPTAPDIYNSPAFDRLLGRPLQPGELTATVDKRATTVSELESHNEKVRIYQLN